MLPWLDRPRAQVVLEIKPFSGTGARR